MSNPRHPMLIAALMCSFALLACSSLGVSSRHPDEVLFERAMDAAQQGHFSAARLTLGTLISTYPDSRYAHRAELALQDPRIATCGYGWATSIECDYVDPEWPE